MKKGWKARTNVSRSEKRGRVLAEGGELDFAHQKELTLKQPGERDSTALLR
jgi:hypothetical protein